MNQNRLPLWISAGVVAVIVLFVLFSSIYVIDQREQAVILQFGKPVASRTEPGLYFKVPFIQEVRRLPKTLQFWQSGADSLTDLPTADGKKINVSAWAVWKITDPKAFVTNLRTLDQGELAVMVRVRSALRDIITAHDLEEVVRSTDRELTYTFQDLFTTQLAEMETKEGEKVQEKKAEKEDAPVAPVPDVAVVQPGVSGEVSIGRLSILKDVEQNVSAQLMSNKAGGKIERGIKLVEVGISDIEFVPKVRQAAFDRQKAFMEAIAAGYINAGEQRKQEILNATQAEVEALLGEGEQQAQILRGEADAKIIEGFAAVMKETGQFYQFIRKLELYEQALMGQTRLILSTDSELLSLLKGVPPLARPAAPADSPESPGVDEGPSVAVEAPR